MEKKVVEDEGLKWEQIRTESTNSHSLPPGGHTALLLKALTCRRPGTATSTSITFCGFTLGAYKRGR